MKINRFKKICLLTMWITLLSDCTMIKMGSLFLAGKLTQKDFSEEISFTYKRRMIFLEAFVNDSPQPYQFLLDTGAALSVVSEEIARQFGIKTTVSDQIVDSGHRRGTIKFGKIPRIRIGHITFENIGSAIMNVDNTPRLKCYGIDGVIGCNMMRMIPFWQINYHKQTIIISDLSRPIDPEGKIKSIPFKKNMQKIPEIKLQFNDQEKIDCTVDLGSGYGLISSLQTWQKIKKNTADITYIEASGEASEGALGVHQTNYILAKLPAISIGGLNAKHTFMVFSGSSFTSIGNSFFENYTLTIDWKEQKLFLKPQTHFQPTQPFTSHGFSYSYRPEKQQLYVSFIYKNSPAAKAGLLIGDSIITINGQDMEKLSMDQYCQLFFKTNDLFKQKHLSLVIKRGKEIKTLHLTSEILIK